LLIIRRDTSVCLKMLKDGPNLLDPDIRVFSHRQFNAMSKLIVFVYPSKMGDPILWSRFIHVAADIVPRRVLRFVDSLMAIIDLT
jgi:hypothetical protein